MIGLIDGNNFFVSCERVFNARLHQKPVLVLSNNDGCVISRSNEAKSLGIKMGQPVFELRSLIKDKKIHVFSSNPDLYRNMSSRMMSVIAEHVQNLEVYSIDEAFCDLSFISNADLDSYGQNIRKKIKQYIGIPCGIGISHTKVLAKLASEFAKKSKKNSGVCTLIRDDHIEYALSCTKVEDIWGIGKRSSRLLNHNRIYTAKEFRDTDPVWIRKKLSIVGLRLQNELKKSPCLGLETIAQDKKSITVSRTFSKYIQNFNDLIPPLSYFVSSASAQLRAQKSVVNRIGVYLTTNHFSQSQTQYLNYKTSLLPAYTSSDFLLTKHAISALKTIYKSGYSYKKCGIYLSGLKSDQYEKTLFWNETESLREKQLFKTIDLVKEKFGFNSIQIADALGSSWKPFSLQRSQNFSTSLDEVMTVC